MKVINLFAGPGVGKSTTAAALFARMKCAGLRVELVTEYPKDLTYERRTVTLGNQLYILGKQDNRIRRLQGHGVDWVITDSPLPLTLLYARPPFDAAWFRHAVMGAFEGYSNVNFLLRRVKPYSTLGRNQTEDEAKVVDETLERLLQHDLFPLECHTLAGDERAPEAIMGLLGLSPGSISRAHPVR